jgi:large subunit ribosomal protein L23
MALFSNKTEEKTEKKEKTSVAASGVKVPAILVAPRISEKASHLATQNKYVFNVAKNANKVEIKKAVESAYKVKVLQVNILNTEGKHRNYGRTSGRMSDFKKAIVTLRQGDKIEMASVA